MRVPLEDGHPFGEQVLVGCRKIVEPGLHSLPVSIERGTMLSIGLGEQTREGELLSHDAAPVRAVRDLLLAAALARRAM